MGWLDFVRAAALGRRGATVSRRDGVRARRADADGDLGRWRGGRAGLLRGRRRSGGGIGGFAARAAAGAARPARAPQLPADSGDARRGAVWFTQLLEEPLRARIARRPDRRDRRALPRPPAGRRG